MSHSNSSLNCFAACMAKYEHSYILHTPTCKPVSPHLTFGTMAHEVLYKAGVLRDECMDGVREPEYSTIIPSEILYPELKEEFCISSWDKYFTGVIKQLAKYEKELSNIMLDTGEQYEIQREVKLSLAPDELPVYSTQPLVGIVDLLFVSKNYAIIIDYKFSSNRKTQDDFDMNSQLPLYAYLVHKLYGVPLRNIQYGYIDIPKLDFGTPVVLSTGKLSRAKSQNVSQDIYAKAVVAIHGVDDYYNCDPGGYYHECWCSLAFNKPAYLSLQWLDSNVFDGVINDLFNAIQFVENMSVHKLPYLKKYDSYSCKNCEYVDSCKPWTHM